jgi:hypothetical protein
VIAVQLRRPCRRYIFFTLGTAICVGFGIGLGVADGVVCELAVFALGAAMNAGQESA